MIVMLSQAEDLRPICDHPEINETLQSEEENIQQDQLEQIQINSKIDQQTTALKSSASCLPNELQHPQPLKNQNQPILNNITQYLNERKNSFIERPISCTILNNLNEPNPSKLNNCEQKFPKQPQPIFNNLVQNPINKSCDLIGNNSHANRLMPLRRVSAHTQPQANNNNNFEGLLNSCNTKAMRYYRIWIYTCNAVLLLSVFVFCVVAGKILITDYKRYLIPNLTLYQPSFLYAYLALLTQSGVLQFIGCIGALRLNERLLNVYWMLLLLLLLGDAVIGIFWMFRFEKICSELQPILKYRLNTEYGSEPDFTMLWDRLQGDYKCCGVLGAQDFNINKSAYHADWNSITMAPSSCCSGDDILSGQIARRPIASAVVFRPDVHENISDSLNHVLLNNRIPRGPAEPREGPCTLVHKSGCEERLLLWLRQTADVLFVLGYCVIAFLKLCFLGILRYEIREMIQKIKILQSEMNAAASILNTELNTSPNHLGSSPGTNHQPPSHTIMINTSMNVNGGLHAHSISQNINDTKITNNRANRQSSGESERESLLVPTTDTELNLTTPLHQNTSRTYLSNDNLKLHQNKMFLNENTHKHLYNAENATDSDTNSNCALIIEDTSVLNTPINAGSIGKNINGNNNYELHEFETKNNYRLLSSSTATKI